MSRSSGGHGTVAVLDVGKTNIKLSAVSPDGEVMETISAPNLVLDDTPWRRHALAATEAWLLPSLGELCRRHAIEAFIATGHGSAGVLVRADEIGSPEPALPMIDYEQPLPGDVGAAYAREAGPFFDRGSATMLGATHQARQMLWTERERPDAFAAAEAFLGVPQYWAWRLSGVMAGEITYLGAQSHLWNVPQRRFAAIVERRGWERLMPPLRRADEALGIVRPNLAKAHGLPEGLRVHTGVHDSSANFYRYQDVGLVDFTLVSTGTWIVAMSDHADPAILDEHRGMTCNADIAGRPLGGCLTMGGREFSLIAGEQPEGASASSGVVSRLLDRGTMALPSFFRDDGLFPGSAERGRIHGPPPADAAERLALAVLYGSLLTRECLDALGSRGLVVLDGTFLRDPLYAALVGALLPDGEVRFNRRGDGIASGAARLAAGTHTAENSALALEPAPAFDDATKLTTYADRWRQLASTMKEDPR